MISNDLVSRSFQQCSYRISSMKNSDNHKFRFTYLFHLTIWQMNINIQSAWIIWIYILNHDLLLSISWLAFSSKYFRVETFFMSAGWRPSKVTNNRNAKKFCKPSYPNGYEIYLLFHSRDSTFYTMLLLLVVAWCIDEEEIAA